MKANTGWSTQQTPRIGISIPAAVIVLMLAAGSALAVPSYTSYISLGGGVAALPYGFTVGATDLAETAAITRNAGDYHPANPSGAAGDAAAMPRSRNNGIDPTGVLPRDSAGSGVAALQWTYNLGATVGVGEIRVWAQNDDGRAWLNMDVLVSDDGAAYSPLLTDVITEPDGVFPSANAAVVSTGTLLRLHDSAGGLLTTTRYIRFRFYDVSNTAGAFWDEFDPGAGDLDGQAAAFEAPNIQEIEILNSQVPAELSLFASD